MQALFTKKKSVAMLLAATALGAASIAAGASPAAAIPFRCSGVPETNWGWANCQDGTGWVQGEVKCQTEYDAPNGHHTVFHYRKGPWVRTGPGNKSKAYCDAGKAVYVFVHTKN